MNNNRLKIRFYSAIGFILLSALMVILAMKINSNLSSMLIGLAGGFTGISIRAIYEYFHYSKPENKVEYEERLDEIKRSRKDERLNSLRDKSGRISYLITLAVGTISIWAIALLQYFNIIEYSRIFMIYLGAYVLFQLIIGFVVFNYLNKKY